MRYNITGGIEFDGALVTLHVIDRCTNQKVTVKAQLDIGSPVSCASYAKVLKLLGVPLFDKVNLSHLQTDKQEENERYQVGIEIPFPQGLYSWEKVTIIRKELKDAPYDVVVGRDMLERCFLTYDGRERFFSLVIEN